MKTKLVLWGSNAQDEKILIAIELVTEDSTVKVYTFPEASVTEEFNNLMLEEWRDGKAVEFPDGYSVEERPLSVTSRLLPDGMKVEREDVVVRAQTEWHFIILSSKLNDAYRSELEDFKDRISKLSKFENSLWEELKAFWSKVQTQVRDRNLFREHADSLRQKTNGLFDEMKGLRNKMDEEFKKTSDVNRQNFMDQLQKIEDKISKGMRLQSIFDELKSVQRRFRDTKFTKEHRSKVWDRLDSAFKTVKEKRFGPGANKDNSPFERLQRRYNGLLAAIEKMQRSIKRDEDDLKFQQRKIERTDGQLEAQIRQAKILMIEERIRSKNEKLTEMTSTQVELESRLESLRKKEEERKERQKIEEAKKAAQAKIAKDIKEATKQSYEEQGDKLEKAAAALTDSKPEEPTKEEAPKEEKSGETLLSAAGATLGEAFKDVLDTAKAVAGVVENKLEDAVEGVVDNVKEFMKKDSKEQASDEALAATDSPEEKASTVEAVKEKVGDALEKAEDMTDKVEDKIDAAVDKAAAKAEAIEEKIEDKVEEVVDKIKSSDMAGKIESGIEKAKETAEKLEEKIEDTVEGVVEKIKSSEMGENVKQAMEKAGDIADKIEDQIEDTVEKAVGAIKNLLGGKEEEEE